MSVVAQLTGVSKRFRGRAVLEDVDLTVAQGACIAVQGPNGSGKSVLFKIICGFVRPDSGSVHINPRYLDPRNSFPQEFGVLIDRPGYLPHRTGFDNLQSLAAIRGRIGEQEIVAAMERVGLDPGLSQRVAHYSLGMKQKLALAQSFMEGQSVLLLDEPFNGLDESSVARVAALLESFLNEGRTLVFTSHQQADVDRLARQRYRIDAGRLLQQTA
jgi:ABC-2 type transport system ATP-binding protein